MNLLCLIVSFVVGWAATRALVSHLTRRGILDVPNDRSSHINPTPRGGGIGIIAGVSAGLFAAWLLAIPLPRVELLIGAALIALVGFIDDQRGGLDARLRFIAHFAAACIVVFSTGGLVHSPLPAPLDFSFGIFGVPLALLWIVAVTNIYNFLDGIDGFAGLQGVLAGIAIAALIPNTEAKSIGLLVAGACAGFLIMNWHPAKVFMGDVGSGTLGFLFAAIPFEVAAPERGEAVLFVAVSLWFFLSDGTFTIVRRLVRGEKIWQPHCSHIYQRLAQSGFRHDEVALVIGTATISLVGLAFAVQQTNQPQLKWLVLAVAAGSFVIYWYQTQAREHRMKGSTQMVADMLDQERAQDKIKSKLNHTRRRTKQLHITLDLVVLMLAFALSFLLRFDFEIPIKEVNEAFIQLPFVVLLQFTVLVLAGVYTFIWRYIGMAEVKVFLLAALWSALPLLLLRLFLPNDFQTWRVPLSIIVMDTLLGFGGVLGLRVMRRAVYEQYEKQQKRLAAGTTQRASVLLLGAGRAGVLTAKEIRNCGDIDLDVKGFIDDDPEKQGSNIYGFKVLGTMKDLPRLASELKIDQVIISIAQASRKEFRSILDVCEHAQVKVRIIPGIHELLKGKVTVSRIRDVQIEDLLGREPVQLEEENVRSFLTGKVVMVTGAGGSIGAEMVRQVAQLKPECLMLIERAEYSLYNIDREIRAAHPHLDIATLIADVGDAERMRSIFAKHNPQVVLHAAAHKHVPMMEDNPCEAIKNNVLATHLLGDLAGEFGTEAFVLISTDKAVRPTSVMGAAKRVAELALQNLNAQYDTRFVAVRFGNVIGSAGSVIPLFREQIRKGGPVTVTHPDMVRYFMTIPEAVQLVLQAGAMGAGGEIFVLDMGEPVKILDLAKDTISLSGLKPYEDIEIVFTGLRAGEKLFEELEMTAEHMNKTRHPRIFIGKISAYPQEEVRHALARLEQSAVAGCENEIRYLLNEILPEAKVKVFGDAPQNSETVEERHFTTANKSIVNSASY